MVRVITGTAKGRKLLVPTSARPLTDRIKTSIFDTIVDFIPNADVLDLYSGSGNFGIESLSRGAKSATFLELSDKAGKLIKENIKNTGFEDKSRLFVQNSNTFLEENVGKEKFDLIFSDPPFEKVYKARFDLLSQFLNPDGLAVIRYPTNFSPDGRVGDLKEILTKSYGESVVGFYKA